MKKVLFLLLVPILGILMVGNAMAVELTFSEPDFEWNSQGGGSPYHIWNTGDYWRQNFNNTGLGFAASLELDLFILNDYALAVQSLDFDVFINSIDIGDFIIPASTSGLQNFDFIFSDIAGDDFFIELVAKSTIAPGAGSFSIVLDGGVSTATLLGEPVPEPSTMLLLGIGLVGLAGVTRRKLKK